MKDFFARVTFGFFMSQLFPGALAAFAITFAYRTFQGTLPGGVLASIDDILRIWQNAMTAELLFLFGLCVGFGMLIHGIHWSVLGTLETRTGGERSIFSDKWYNLRIAGQLLCAPIRLVYELGLFVLSPNTEAASIRENVACIGKDWMLQHEFMQDFYLYPAQFFAHTAYALMVSEAALGYYMLRCSKYGFTGRRAVLFCLLYFGASAFLVLSRIQLQTLFSAERTLMTHDPCPPKDTIAK